jgi:hypothetical protein
MIILSDDKMIFSRYQATTEFAEPCAGSRALKGTRPSSTGARTDSTAHSPALDQVGFGLTRALDRHDVGLDRA